MNKIRERGETLKLVGDDGPLSLCGEVSNPYFILPTSQRQPVIKKPNRILQNHAGWLWGDGQYEKAIECVKQSYNDKRVDIINSRLKKLAKRDSKGRFIK